MTNHQEAICVEELLSLSDLLNSSTSMRNFKYSEDRRNRKFRPLYNEEKNIVTQMAAVKVERHDFKTVIQ